MPRLRCGSIALQLPLIAAMFFIVCPGQAQTVWSGLTHEFTRADGVDGSLPENQDMITPNVIFARASTAGLYNASSELGYGSMSPEFTEWATGLVVGNEELTISAENYSALTFTTWTEAYGGTANVGNLILGESAVVHLIFEDIYLDIQFTEWAIGREGGQGGFAYIRAEPPAPEPTGDYNGNGFVDAADYVLWRDTFGEEVEMPGDGADGDGDRMIDQDDYDYWRTRFGNEVAQIGSSGASVAVPEPSVGLLILIGVLSDLWLVRRRKSIEKSLPWRTA